MLVKGKMEGSGNNWVFLFKTAETVYMYLLCISSFYLILKERRFRVLVLC